ncbi:MAG: flagellin FliC [Deltaproteobacteria bacterium]|nr:flagellin FliC [Deltaproteobacteria bacterium]
MGLVINTNTSAINAQRNLGKSQEALGTSLSRLSSGMRITSAKDDAAGLAISEKLNAQVRGLGQAERNANDGISLVQTAEGALNETGNILTRMRELSVQASTGTLGSEERGYLDNEFSELVEEIDRISAVTEFNGTSLLDGSASGGIDIQVGINSGTDNQISISIADSSASGIGVDSLDISTATGAQAALATIDTAIQTVSGTRGTLGAKQNRLSITVNNLASARENLAAANSRIRDVDVADETVNMTRNQILTQAGVSVLAQANQLPGMALSLIR